jgi:hypothetical protein
MLLLSNFLLLCLSGFSQQLFVEAYSGYNLTAYDRDIYSESSSYFPLGFKLGGGFEHVQLGLEYRQHITDPEFEVESDQVKTRHSFDETYYGAFVRGNISSLPAYRFGLILGAGAGYYQPVFRTLPPGDDDTPLRTVDYDKNLGYNFYIGISAPIYAQLHWEIGYNYNLVQRQEILAEKLPKYNSSYHMIHLGLSGNFVFGNTEKRCRQVITSSRRRR